MRAGSWGRRLVWSLFAVLLIMGGTVAGTALLVGPTLFDLHMREAGHDQPGVLEHASQAYRDAVTVSLGTGLAVSVAIAVLAAWLLNRSLARGLDELIDGAARVSRGDYDQPVTVPHAGRELEQVAGAFNAMAAQIATTEATRRRILTDLGHELRTPLAAVQVTLEGLQDGVVDYSPATVEVLLQQNRRLSALAADISDVSRAEEGRLSVELRRAEVDDVVRACLDTFARPCADAGVALHARLNSRAQAELDPARIGQVMDNLLRNALQHSRRGDSITVATRRRADRVVVSVADTGAGIAAADLPHLFERFYRGAQTRTRDVDGGSGVGLAIARAIVRAHGGDLRAASAGPGRGATFTWEMPTA